MRDGGREHAGGSNEEGGRHFLAPHYFAGASGRLAGRLERLLGGLSRLFCDGRGLSRRGRARGDGRLGRGGRRPRRLELPHLLARKPAVGLVGARAADALPRLRVAAQAGKGRVCCGRPPRSCAPQLARHAAAGGGGGNNGDNGDSGDSGRLYRRSLSGKGRLGLGLPLRPPPTRPPPTRPPRPCSSVALHCRRCRRRSSWRQRRARLAQAASLSGCSEEGQGASPWSEPGGPCST
jgi:hypothetical protein